MARRITITRQETEASSLKAFCDLKKKKRELCLEAVRRSEAKEKKLIRGDNRDVGECSE